MLSSTIHCAGMVYEISTDTCPMSRQCGSQVSLDMCIHMLQDLRLTELTESTVQMKCVVRLPPTISDAREAPLRMSRHVKTDSFPSGDCKSSAGRAR